MKDSLWRRDYPDVTDAQLARWTAEVDKALSIKTEIEHLLERLRRKSG